MKLIIKELKSYLSVCIILTCFIFKFCNSNMSNYNNASYNELVQEKNIEYLINPYKAIKLTDNSNINRFNIYLVIYNLILKNYKYSSILDIKGNYRKIKNKLFFLSLAIIKTKSLYYKKILIIYTTLKLNNNKSKLIYYDVNVISRLSKCKKIIDTNITNNILKFSCYNEIKTYYLHYVLNKKYSSYIKNITTLIKINNKLDRNLQSKLIKNCYYYKNNNICLLECPIGTVSDKNNKCIDIDNQSKNLNCSYFYNRINVLSKNCVYCKLYGLFYNSNLPQCIDHIPNNYILTNKEHNEINTCYELKQLSFYFTKNNKIKLKCVYSCPTGYVAQIGICMLDGFNKERQENINTIKDNYDNINNNYTFYIKCNDKYVHNELTNSCQNCPINSKYIGINQCDCDVSKNLKWNALYNKCECLKYTKPTLIIDNNLMACDFCKGNFYLNNYNKCIECKEHYEIKKVDNICLPKCPDGFIPDFYKSNNITSICIKCNKNTYSYYGSCLKCKDNEYVFNNKCKSCKLGYIYNEEYNSCVSTNNNDNIILLDNNIKLDFDLKLFNNVIKYNKELNSEYEVGINNFNLNTTLIENKNLSTTINNLLNNYTETIKTNMQVVPNIDILKVADAGLNLKSIENINIKNNLANNIIIDNSETNINKNNQFNNNINYIRKIKKDIETIVKHMSNYSLFTNEIQNYNSSSLDIVINPFVENLSNIKTIEEAKINNKSYFTFLNCEEKIKKDLNITNFAITKIDYKSSIESSTTPTINNINGNSYSVLLNIINPKNKKLINIPKHCLNETITIYYPIESKEIDLKYYNSYKQNGLDIYNTTDRFYTDACYVLTNSTSDSELPVSIRVNKLSLNATIICSESCVYKGIDKYDYVICECSINTMLINRIIESQNYNKTLLLNNKNIHSEDILFNKKQLVKAGQGNESLFDFAKLILNDLDNFDELISKIESSFNFKGTLIDVISYSNFRVFSCYKQAFDPTILRNNVGFYTLLILTILLVLSISIVLFFYNANKIKHSAIELIDCFIFCDLIDVNAYIKTLKDKMLKTSDRKKIVLFDNKGNRLCSSLKTINNNYNRINLNNDSLDSNNKSYVKIINPIEEFDYAYKKVYKRSYLSENRINYIIFRKKRHYFRSNKIIQLQTKQKGTYYKKCILNNLKNNLISKKLVINLEGEVEESNYTPIISKEQSLIYFENILNFNDNKINTYALKKENNFKNYKKNYGSLYNKNNNIKFHNKKDDNKIRNAKQIKFNNLNNIHSPNKVGYGSLDNKKISSKDNKSINASKIELNSYNSNAINNINNTFNSNNSDELYKRDSSKNLISINNKRNKCTNINKNTIFHNDSFQFKCIDLNTVLEEDDGNNASSQLNYSYISDISNGLKNRNINYQKKIIKSTFKTAKINTINKSSTKKLISMIDVKDKNLNYKAYTTGINKKNKTTKANDSKKRLVYFESINKENFKMHNKPDINVVNKDIKKMFTMHECFTLPNSKLYIFRYIDVVNMKFDDVIKYDNRCILRYSLDLWKNKYELYLLFVPSQREDRKMKILLFILSISLEFSLNALFYSDNYIEKRSNYSSDKNVMIILYNIFINRVRGFMLFMKSYLNLYGLIYLLLYQ